MLGDVRVLLVEYSAGCMKVYWCDLGQVLHVVKGELDSELRPAPTFMLRPGMSYRCPIKAVRRAARWRKPAPNSSSSINIAESRTLYLCRLQNNLRDGRDCAF